VDGPGCGEIAACAHKPRGIWCAILMRMHVPGDATQTFGDTDGAVQHIDGGELTSFGGKLGLRARW
jgi:hypothetical protein